MRAPILTLVDKSVFGAYSISRFSALLITLPVFLIWGSSYPTMSASETSQQVSSTEDGLKTNKKFRFYFSWW